MSYSRTGALVQNPAPARLNAPRSAWSTYHEAGLEAFDHIPEEFA